MKGGVALSTENQSCLRFSLEESVWFQRGQEVAELISISLDPDITIQENDQYVTIKGSLELTGEYKCPEQDEEEIGSSPLNGRQVHSIQEREEEGILEFRHQFPVDITIPQNRIQSIYEIDITVESFDYDFPERNSMKLTAELAITGLYGEQQHGSDVEVEEEESASPVEIPDLEPLYRQTATAEVETETQAEIETPAQASHEPVEVVSQETEHAEDPPYKEISFVSQSEEQEETKNQESAGLYEPFRAEARKEPQPVEENKSEPVLSRQAQEEEEQQEPVASTQQAEGVEEREAVAQHNNVTELPVSAVESELALEERAEAEVDEVVQQGPIINEKAKVEETELEESSSSSSSDEKPKSKKFSKKKGLSIAEFLARKEETEVAKLRVCIVQHDDTLQQIADRYEVSVQQLVNLNNLGLDANVSEGQVLYVPAEYVAGK